MSKYRRIEKLGSGAFGAVYKVERISDGQIFAAKKYYSHGDDRNGIDATTIRELSDVQALNHPNIIKLIDIEQLDKSDKTIYGIYEYEPYDLRQYMDKNDINFDKVKTIMVDLLSGLAYAHNKGIFHRDLKPQNLLYNPNKNKIKIGDWGASRYLEFNSSYTPTIVTLWYRAPEVLLGEEKYTEKIDMWSVGCILLELFNKTAIFKGDSDIGQLYEIFKFIGTPNENACKELTKLKFFNLENFPKWKVNNISTFYDQFKFLSSDEKYYLSILTQGLLNCNPSERFSALKALENPLFKDFHLNLKLESFQDNINSSWSYYNIIDYFSNGEIKPTMRLLLYDWLFTVGYKFGLKYDTIFQAYLLCDSYLSKSNISKKKYQLLGMTCLYISSKLLEIYFPPSYKYVSMAAGAYELDELLKMEQDILSTFKFLIPPILLSSYFAYTKTNTSNNLHNFFRIYFTTLPFEYPIIKLLSNINLDKDNEITKRIQTELKNLKSSDLSSFWNRYTLLSNVSSIIEK